MTKDELYRQLIDAHHRHQSKNTKCTAYVDAVVKLVKEYLEEKEPVIEVDQSTRDYWAEDVKHLQELSDWMNKQWNS